MFYAERNNKLINKCEITFDDLKDYFYKIYKYFYDKKYFDAAIKGIWIKPKWEDSYLAVAPLFGPSPELFFLQHLKSNEIYPIYEYYDDYTEDELFTVIEILYSVVAKYDYEEDELITDMPKDEFALQINNILKFYKDGYYIEKNSGYIFKSSNEAIMHMLSEDLTDIVNDNVLESLRTAIKSYYKYNSNIEEKRGAIRTLANILEPLRDELKSIFNDSNYIPKNEHDKLIFEVVNRFGIRHNDLSQKTNYNINIWFDWMMQYYVNVIITYYKLIKENEEVL